MMIDANHLTYLLAIARTGSFSRAAIELGQSQPTLSNNVAILERRLGVRLLERSKRGSTLTAHGEILVRRAEALTSILEDAVAEVRNLDLAISGPLKIGATPSTLPSFLPLALSLMGPKLMSSQLELIEDLDNALAAQLVSGRVDMIVGPVFEQFTSIDGITEVALLEDPFCIATSLDSELGKRKSISIEDLLQKNVDIAATWEYLSQARRGYVYQPRGRMAKEGGLCQFALFDRGYGCFGRLRDNCIPIAASSPAPEDQTLSDKGRSYRKIGYKIRTKGRLAPIGLELKDSLEKAALQMKKEFEAIGLGG